MKHKRALIKIYNGLATLLCNRCFTTVQENFNPKDVEDVEHHCEKCRFELNFVIRGLNKRD